MHKLRMMVLPLALVGIGCGQRENAAPQAQATQADSAGTMPDAEVSDVSDDDVADNDKGEAGESEEETTIGDRPEKPAAGKSKLSDVQIEQMKWLKKLTLSMMAYSFENAARRYIPEETGSWRITLAKARDDFDPEQLKDKDGKTRLLLVTGPGTLFDRTNAEWGSRERGVQAWRSTDTIPLLIVVGPNVAVGVEEERDFVFDPKDPKAGLGDADDPFLVVMANGMIRALPKSISREAFTALCQIDARIDEAMIDDVDAELREMGFPFGILRIQMKQKR